MLNRRQFTLAAISSALGGTLNAKVLVEPLSAIKPVDATTKESLRSKLSLSQWSFHRAILGNSKQNYEKFIRLLHSQPDEVLQGELDPRDIVSVARDLDIAMVDLVNVLFFGRARDAKWLHGFLSRANDNGVGFQVLMCDELGALGASKPAQRKQAIDAHLPWLECAATLGCKQLRVNAWGDGSYLQQLHQCAESMTELATIAKSYDVELLVENHGYASNNGAWLAMLIELTNHDNFGAFTDLDNFFMGGWNLTPERRYDSLQGALDLAPHTRGVSVKSHDFDSSGNETSIDYQTLLKVFEDTGFNGLYSIEYEGNHLTEMEGTQATAELVLRNLARMSSATAT